MNTRKEKYITEISKKLESFKSAKEWSDFISLLTSLDTTIKSYSMSFIPKKKLLSKRLEQCLNPLLPAGVHNKALETFSIIFETISREELEDNFGIYTLGLFTFASHSRLMVMNHYLDVLEKYIIPLGSNIQIYSPNIILGLLPPLESKANEYYTRSTLILNDFKSKIDENVFYFALWNLFISNSNIRLAIVNYLLDTTINIDKVACDKALVVRALTKGLESKESLVLRGTLDVISSIFPLDTKDLNNNFKCDLLESMLRIFLRRDLTLNKRVFAWMGFNIDADNLKIQLLKSTLVRYLNSEKDLLVFFKIFSTLSSKSRLSEQILESLLFKVFKQLKKYLKKNDQEKNVEEESMLSKEVIDIQSFSKSFLVEDLDVLWKIFYIKLNSSINKNRTNNKPLDIEAGEDTENLIQIILQRDDWLDENNSNNDILIPVDSEISQVFEENIVKDDTQELVYSQDQVYTQELIDEDDFNEMDVSEILYYINFCCENYNTFDDTVIGTHLPIFILSVLKSRSFFDEQVLLKFLSNNVKKIRLKEQTNNEDVNLFLKIDTFYKEEDLSMLQSIKDKLCASLISLLGEVVKSNIESSHSFFVDFVLNHREIFVFDEYIKIYYDAMLNSSLKTIGNSIRLFRWYNKGCVCYEKLFVELWNRFCRQNNVPIPNNTIYNEPRWEISLNSELTTVTNAQNTGFRSVSNLVEKLPLDRKTVYGKEVNDEQYDYEAKAMDKKYIVVLTYDYNLLFQGKFEKYLLRKVSEENKHNVSLFIHYLFELENNADYYFYNLFFIINNKISGQDPVITALIKSLVDFDNCFKFLIKKFEESSIFSKDLIYIDEPNLNQLKGILMCLKNMIIYSRRFRVMLKSSESTYYCDLFDDKKELKGKNIVYKMLKYLFLCEIKKSAITFDESCMHISSLEIRNKLKSDQRATNLLREIKIDCIQLIRDLAIFQVIEKNDVVDEDLPAVLSLLWKYRLDPAIILPSTVLIRIAGKQNFLLEFSTILDSQCFYYFDFLEFLFQLPISQKKLILCDILSNVGKDNYGLMIKYEIIKEIITLDDSAINWSRLVQIIIRDSISFYEEDMSPIYILEDQAKKKNSTEIHFNVSTNPSLTFKNDLEHKDFNSHTLDIKVKAIVKTASLIYSKLSGYFIEHLISLPFQKRFIKDLNFKINLFSNILASYSGNYDKVFNFMIEFYDTLAKEEKIEAYAASKQALSQIINYRTETYPSTLLFLLKIFGEQTRTVEEVSSFLTIIYQTISFIQKNLDNRRVVDHTTFPQYLSLMNYLSNIDYIEKIRSANQTYIGLLIDLLKHNDRIVATSALAEILRFSDNKSINESMWYRNFMEYFNNSEFFFFEVEQKSRLIRKIADYRVEVIDDLVARLDSSFFASQVSDINTKTSVLLRMSFLIFSASYNKYDSFNIKLIEIVPNLIQHSSPKIKKNVLFLIRIMLNKIDHMRLSTLFPILFTELLTILRNINIENKKVISESIKLIDMIFLLNTQQVYEFKNILSNRKPDVNDTADKSTGNILIFDKTISELKRKHDFKVCEQLQVTKNRRLFLKTQNLTIDDIGNFLMNCGEFYLLQDKECSEIDKDEVDRFILEEFKQ